MWDVALMVSLSFCLTDRCGKIWAEGSVFEGHGHQNPISFISVYLQRAIKGNCRESVYNGVFNLRL